MAGAPGDFSRGRRSKAVAALSLKTFPLAAALVFLSHASARAQTEAGSAEQPPVIDRVTLIRQNVFSAKEKQEGILGDHPSITAYRFGATLSRDLGRKGLDVAGWANRLHFKTQPGVIRPDILFKPGDPLDPSLLEETERNLRSLGYLRDASVTSEIASPGHADVTVLTKDAWTLYPLLSFSLIGGGHFTGEAGIAESNLFGFGKQAEFDRSSERFREVTFLGYNDPRVFDTHWHLIAQGSEDSDGRVRGALFEYPFWSLRVSDSIGASFAHVLDQERLFSQDHHAFRHWQTAATFSAAHALDSEPDLVRRIGLRYQLFDDSFGPPPRGDGVPASGLAPRRTSALELTLTEWHPNFVKAYYLDQLGHTEDRDLGTALQTRVGYSPALFGASRSELVMGTSAGVGGRIRDRSYGWLWIQVSGREGAGRVRDGFITLEGIGYRRLGDLLNCKQTLVLDARTDLSSGLFRDHEFVIGTDDGRLRGYPINFRAGTRRVLFHVEDRLTIVEDLLHLVSLGVAGFVDVGQVWGRGGSLSWSGMLASTGIGLRLAGTRATFQTPVRLDFEVPLFHHRGVGAADFSASGGQEFGVFGQPYANEQNSVADPETLAPDSAASPYPNASPFTHPGSGFAQY